MRTHVFSSVLVYTPASETGGAAILELSGGRFCVHIGDTQTPSLLLLLAVDITVPCGLRDVLRLSGKAHCVHLWLLHPLYGASETDLILLLFFFVYVWPFLLKQMRL